MRKLSIVSEDSKGKVRILDLISNHSYHKEIILIPLKKPLGEVDCLLNGNITRLPSNHLKYAIVLNLELVQSLVVRESFFRYLVLILPKFEEYVFKRFT